MVGMNFYVGGLPLHSAEGLVDHYLAVRESEALSLCAGRKKERTHACRHADADRRYIAFDVVHRVIDSESGGD